MPSSTGCATDSEAVASSFRFAPLTNTVAVRFAEVIGQDAAKDLLRRLADEQRLPHALMLVGGEGSGHLPLALALARYVLCEAPREGEPCEQCTQCRHSAHYTHPDLHFSFPTVGSKATSEQYYKQWREALEENPYLNVHQWLMRLDAENRQGNITRDECVQIVKKLSLKTFEGRHKVLLMWMPEYLGKEGNRLLKLIEEPPPHTIFLFVAENPDLILGTILSRCQIVRLSPLTDEQIARALQQREGLDAEQALAFAQIADGNYNKALELARTTDQPHAQVFVDWLRKCYARQGAALVQWCNEAAKWGREPQKNFLHYGLHFWRELLVWNLSGHTMPLRLLPAEQETARKMARVVGPRQIEAIAKLFDEAIFHIERNANPKILFMDLSIRLGKLMRQPSITPSAGKA